MKVEYNKNNKYLADSADEPVKILTPAPTSHNIFFSLGYRAVAVDYQRLLVDRKILDEFFEPVENINYVEFLKKSGNFITYTQVYKNKEFNYFILVDPDVSDPEDGDDYDFREGVYKLSYVYYDSTDQSGCKTMVDSLNTIFTVPLEDQAVIYVVLKTSYGYRLKRELIKPFSMDVKTMYNDDFKPVYDNIVDKLHNTKKGIVLLDGTAGTGKTNMIKNLTKEIPEKKFIYVSSNMIPSLTDPAFIGLLMENKGSILVLEDCETYLKDRESAGNEVVSSLLNLSDGIMSDVLELQIIATFNAGIESIDRALLREGRLISEYKFEVLSIDKTKKLLKKLKKETSDDPMTLAQIYNSGNGTSKSQTERKAIGFGK